MRFVFTWRWLFDMRGCGWLLWVTFPPPIPALFVRLAGGGRRGRGNYMNLMDCVSWKNVYIWCNAVLDVVYSSICEAARISIIDTASTSKFCCHCMAAQIISGLSISYSFSNHGCWVCTDVQVTEPVSLISCITYTAFVTQIKELRPLIPQP